MRILFYLGTPAWTGSARAFAALARGLAERGHAVTVACPADSPVEARLEFGAYEVITIDPEAPVSTATRRLRRVLQERFTEVIAVVADRDQGIAAGAARLAERAAILRRFPAGGPLTLSVRARLALRVAATGFVFASSDDAEHAPPVKRTRLAPAIVPLGVRAAVYEHVRPADLAPAGTRLVVCRYDDDARARAGNVLRVAALLQPRHPELRVLMLGPGASDDDLRMHAAALRVSRMVTFTGERDDYLALLARADLGWVIAGGDDGAFATLDLLASGVPVIAEQGTVAPLFVADGITGLVLPPGEPHDAAAEVARLLANAERRDAMGAAGRVRVNRDFTDTAMIDAFERTALVASDRAQW